jgi:TctA family transporter
MLVFGVVGYLLKKLDYPLAPMVLALVLGKNAESSFRQSMLLSNGDLGIFWSTALGTSLMVLAIGLLLSPLLAWLRHRGKEAH